MYCKKCGSKLEADSVFCTSCGNKIETGGGEYSSDSMPTRNNSGGNITKYKAYIDSRGKQYLSHIENSRAIDVLNITNDSTNLGVSMLLSISKVLKSMKSSGEGGKELHAFVNSAEFGEYSDCYDIIYSFVSPYGMNYGIIANNNNYDTIMLGGFGSQGMGGFGMGSGVSVDSIITNTYKQMKKLEGIWTRNKDLYNKNMI